MESLQDLQKAIDSAKSLQSLVKTMKAYASSNINQFQKAAKASLDYKEVLDKSLHIVFAYKDFVFEESNLEGKKLNIIFGSDHGLAGRFNERIAGYTIKEVLQQEESINFVVGQQVARRVSDDLSVEQLFTVPQTIERVSTAVNEMIVEIEKIRNNNKIEEIIMHYNKPIDQISFQESSEKLFPINLKEFARQDLEWNSKRLPTYFQASEDIMSNLIQQYFFIALYRAFCFSLASESASRLSSMQQADENIEERLLELNFEYRRERQNSITEELNDVISGFKAIKKSKK